MRKVEKKPHVRKGRAPMAVGDGFGNNIAITRSTKRVRDIRCVAEHQGSHRALSNGVTFACAGCGVAFKADAIIEAQGRAASWRAVVVAT